VPVRAQEPALWSPTGLREENEPSAAPLPRMSHRGTIRARRPGRICASPIQAGERRAAHKALALAPCRYRSGSYRGSIHGLGHAPGDHRNDAAMIATTLSGRAVSSRLLRAMGTAGLAVALTATLGACGHKERPKADLAASKVTTIGVNSYLWRASLDALSFMPLIQTDSAGGVIVTDWYTNPRNPGERMKVSVTILDQDLRADALRVAASRQVAQNGTWVDAPVQAATVQRLEDVILTKARDLRRQAIAG
jgi:hypothetical protein